MESLRATVSRYAPTPFTVLVTGARGTGKELVARELHERSPRRRGPFVVVDCGSLAASLVESELFGHEAGSFTGAIKERQGLVELAHHGTLFLDEIGNMPVEIQAKLLRFLEDGMVRRVGGKGLIAVETRVVAATNNDLAAAVRERRFLPDLYDRLNVLSIELPQLMDRREDIPILARHFLRRASALLQRELELDDALVEHLTRRPWPGNVRELRNVIYRLAALSTGSTLTPEVLLRDGNSAPAGASEREAVAH